ncbi:hypothetical protein QBC41DRAFT_385798 [Cercophora samala]|uniref:Uncharacterized protein n=1 Tax=Cercophora samala TaxID=330535 RepID=A0AA39YTH8_9PEZI|nr:hypothetical protein QBC41DRAFT_385798 [Cercophora samala]
MKLPILLLHLLPTALSAPLSNDTTTPSSINAPCNFDLGDCPSPLTCIPLSPTCTRWSTLQDTSWPGCPGTCQLIDLSTQRVYRKCAGWGLYFNCDEKTEYCTDDPRNYRCGPSCDDAGICQPSDDWCGGQDKRACREGLACFIHPPAHVQNEGESPYGVCLPLRFGSDYYEKTGLEETWDAFEGGR